MHREFRARRALLFPLGAVGGLCLALLVQSEILGFLCVFALIGSVFVIPYALFARIEIVASTMSGDATPGFPHVQGPVQLDRLAFVESVSARFGMYGNLGPGFFRPFIRFVDADGGEFLMYAGGWGEQRELFGILREAALRSNAHVDGMTRRRLGIPREPGTPHDARTVQFVFFKRRSALGSPPGVTVTRVYTYPSSAERPMPVVIGATPDRARAILRAAEVDHVFDGEGSRVVATEPQPGEETLGRATPAVVTLG
jgi:hypothetical protein